jgi:hypothetical protein
MPLGVLVDGRPLAAAEAVDELPGDRVEADRLDILRPRGAV